MKFLHGRLSHQCGATLGGANGLLSDLPCLQEVTVCEHRLKPREVVPELYSPQEGHPEQEKPKAWACPWSQCPLSVACIQVAWG